MRVLFISNLYPNQIFPAMASFNRQQIAVLSEFCEIDVLSPVPWTVGVKNLKKLAPRKENPRVKVYHPTYYYTPRILRGLYGSFFLASIYSSASRLLSDNRYDLIYSSWLFPDSWAAARLARLYNLPLVIKVHGTDVNLLQPGSSITRKSLSVIEQARKVICVSRALKERLILLGASEEKMEVVYNGVDTAIFHPMDKQSLRRQLNIPSDTFLVLFVGNLKKDKGLTELVTAFKEVKEQNEKSQLVIIGSGSFKSEINKLATELCISDDIQLLGTQPLEVISQWMNAASTLCLPSYMEGIPNVLLEAFACGTTVVATSVGGIPELDRGNNMLKMVPPRDSISLAKALIETSTECLACDHQHPATSWRENALKLYTIFGERS